VRKGVDIFALSIYRFVIFPKALRYIDKVVSDLFDRLDKRVTPILVILAKTFRSLTTCRRADYSPLKEFLAIPRRENIFEKKWMVILQSLQEEDVERRAPWMIFDEILYRCGDFNWVLLFGIWRAIGYAPVLVLRQYRLRQFIPIIQGLAQCEFAYKGDNYKKKVCEISNAENQTHNMKRFTTNPMMTPEYDWWCVRDRKARLQKKEFTVREKDRKVRRGKDSARIRRRHPKVGLRARVVELERSLQQYRSHNFVIELKASLTKIEELKGKIEELEPALQNCKL
ncbi:hypothetical protein Golob_005423, partial [Gossypium lobatum]|nr:hypothetical protein [Gossypium lobatum]